jgi:hypothetical protein
MTVPPTEITLLRHLEEDLLKPEDRSTLASQHIERFARMWPRFDCGVPSGN